MDRRALAVFHEKYDHPDYFWHVLDEQIRAAFTDRGRPTDVQDYFARIALVNRVYRANLAREREVAEECVKRNLDVLCAPLKGITSFSRASLPVILDVHERFVKLVRRVTDRGELSFCAKYLSFQFPSVVPIYDSRANAAVWHIIGDDLEHLDESGTANEAYRYFCVALLVLADTLRARDGREPDLKLMDVALYSPDP